MLGLCWLRWNHQQVIFVATPSSDGKTLSCTTNVNTAAYQRHVPQRKSREAHNKDQLWNSTWHNPKVRRGQTSEIRVQLPQDVLQTSWNPDATGHPAKDTRGKGISAVTKWRFFFCFVGGVCPRHDWLDFSTLAESKRPDYVFRL